MPGRATWTPERQLTQVAAWQTEDARLNRHVAEYRATLCDARHIVPDPPGISHTPERLGG
jgi:hypothetical protein